MIEIGKPNKIAVWSELPWEDNIVVDKLYPDGKCDGITLTYAEAYGVAKRIMHILESDGFEGDKE